MKEVKISRSEARRIAVLAEHLKAKPMDADTVRMILSAWGTPATVEVLVSELRAQGVEL